MSVHQMKLSEDKDQLNRIEQHLIADDEISQLGHRIVYNIETGHSINIFGCFVDSSKLDASGYQIKL